MWNDGRLLTLNQAIDAVKAIVDSEEEPELHAVALILEPDAISKLKKASERYRDDSAGQEAQIPHGVDQEARQYTWGSIKRPLDPDNLADVALAELGDEAKPEDSSTACLKTAQYTLSYLRFVAEFEVPKGHPSSDARVLILGLNAQEVANLEVWQLVPSSSEESDEESDEEDWPDWSWREPGATLESETPAIALGHALDSEPDDGPLWERSFTSLRVAVNPIHSIGSRPRADPPSNYQGVLRTSRWGGRTIAVCGHEHDTWQEASRCVRERLEDLASPSGKRKRGLRDWLR